MTRNALVIHPNGETEILQVEGEDDLAALQEAVGGMIESPSILFDLFQHLTMFLNEEGKIIGLDANPVATALLGYGGIDLLCGPVVVCGPVDEEGEWLSLADSDVERLLGGAAHLRNLFVRTLSTFAP